MFLPKKISTFLKLNAKLCKILNNKFFSATAIFAILILIISNINFSNEAGQLTEKSATIAIKQIEPQAKEVATKILNNEIVPRKIATLEVKSGDNLSSILGRLHVENSDSFAVVKALNKIYSAAKLKVGDKIKIYYQDFSTSNNVKNIVLNQVKINISDAMDIIVSKNSVGEFVAELKEIELFSKLQVKSGKIENSLYFDAEQAGIPAEIIMEFIRFYSFDLDFQRDIQKGDKFLIFYETFYNNEGEFVKNGDIIYCKFITSKREFANYKYTTTKGSTLYFNDEGSSVTKALLRTPISGARLSSRFGYRKHPILGYNKLHTGVDFAAPTGTPIYAAGSGTIDFIGWKGGYGKYIRIRHNGRYKTAYAHMSRFAKGIKKGSKVKQRQVIGYVGSTGRSTGPHLHYEVHQNGKAINPRNLRAESKVTLKDQELEKFLTHKGIIDFILKNAFAEVKL